MKTIAEAAAELAATQQPVLCLDTCVFLDIITAGNRGQADLLGANQRLLEALVTTPSRLRLVVNELIVWEWDQRKEEVRGEATKWLIKADQHILQIHRAWEELGKPLPDQAPSYNKSQLVEDLTNLARSLLGQAIVLGQDTDCVLRALERVKAKKRPSHNGQIKDSIHLEHYLELSRNLRDAGHGEGRIFVSTNKSDFWEDKDKPERPHAELVDDLNAAALTFFGRLPLALRSLGILTLGGSIIP
jgi:hypothetical protein